MKATRLSALILCFSKTYFAKIKLGISTDTLDNRGRILSVQQVPSSIELQDIKILSSEFIGEKWHRIPLYSARKFKGANLYHFARKNISINTSKLPPKLKIIYSFDCFSYDKDEKMIYCSIVCSSGTYIRTIAYELGKRLGCGAILYDLVRTNIGGFSLTNSISLKDILTTPSEILPVIIKPDQILQHYSNTDITSMQEKALYAGSYDITRPGIYNLYNGDRFIGIIANDHKHVKVCKYLSNNLHK
jgi:tRNA pseudouridine55 synthase